MTNFAACGFVDPENVFFSQMDEIPRNMPIPVLRQLLLQFCMQCGGSLESGGGSGGGSGSGGKPFEFCCKQQCGMNFCSRDCWKEFLGSLTKHTCVCKVVQRLLCVSTTKVSELETYESLRQAAVLVDDMQSGNERIDTVQENGRHFLLAATLFDVSNSVNKAKSALSKVNAIGVVNCLLYFGMNKKAAEICFYVVDSARREKTLKMVFAEALSTLAYLAPILWTSAEANIFTSRAFLYFISDEATPPLFRAKSASACVTVKAKMGIADEMADVALKLFRDNRLTERPEYQKLCLDLALLFAREKPELATELLENATKQSKITNLEKIAGNHSTILMRIATIYREMGQFKKSIDNAKEAIRVAHKLAPWSANMLQAMVTTADCYMASGDRELAAAYLREAKSLAAVQRVTYEAFDRNVARLERLLSTPPRDAPTE